MTYLLAGLFALTLALFWQSVRVDGAQRGEWSSIPWYAATFVSMIVTLTVSLLTFWGFP